MSDKNYSINISLIAENNTSETLSQVETNFNSLLEKASKASPVFHEISNKSTKASKDFEILGMSSNEALNNIVISAGQIPGAIQSIVENKYFKMIYSSVGFAGTTVGLDDLMGKITGTEAKFVKLGKQIKGVHTNTKDWITAFKNSKSPPIFKDATKDLPMMMKDSKKFFSIFTSGAAKVAGKTALMGAAFYTLHETMQAFLDAKAMENQAKDMENLAKQSANELTNFTAKFAAAKLPEDFASMPTEDLKKLNGELKVAAVHWAELKKQAEQELDGLDPSSAQAKALTDNIKLAEEQMARLKDESKTLQDHLDNMPEDALPTGEEADAEALAAQAEGMEQLKDKSGELAKAMDANSASFDSNKQAMEEQNAVLKEGAEALGQMQEKAEVDVKVDLDEESAKTAKASVEELVKEYIATLKVEADAKEALAVIAELKKDTSSTHTIKVKKTGASSTSADPEEYADGGSVFRRLSSPVIASGSGVKDDVPAMLMRGEFVQQCLTCIC